MTENRTQRVVIAGVDGSEDGLRATKFAAGSAKARSADPVSYTHLTLPTIYSV